MVIIVEGIDRVGKTTLVNMLHKATGFPVYKNNTEFKLENMDNENETDKMIKMLQICALGNVDIIFDRFHWTDTVYGCLQRGYLLNTALQNKDKIEGVLAEMKAVVCLVRPTDIVNSSKQHGCDLHRHSDLFNMLFNESQLDKIGCTFPTLKDVEKWVNLKINERKFK